MSQFLIKRISDSRSLVARILIGLLSENRTVIALKIKAQLPAQLIRQSLESSATAFVRFSHISFEAGSFSVPQPAIANLNWWRYKMQFRSRVRGAQREDFILVCFRQYFNYSRTVGIDYHSMVVCMLEGSGAQLVIWGSGSSNWLCRFNCRQSSWVFVGKPCISFTKRLKIEHVCIPKFDHLCTHTPCVMHTINSEPFPVIAVSSKQLQPLRIKSTSQLASTN